MTKPFAFFTVLFLVICRLKVKNDNYSGDVLTFKFKVPGLESHEDCLVKNEVSLPCMVVAFSLLVPTS